MPVTARQLQLAVHDRLSQQQHSSLVMAVCTCQSVATLLPDWQLELTRCMQQAWNEAEH